MRLVPEFDYVLPNPDNKLDETVDLAVAILAAERHRTRPRRISL
jgi:hypothetical protein